MSRPYYSEYVRHVLRFYTRSERNPDTMHYRSDVDKRNWLACHSVFKTYSDKDVDVFVSVYSGYDTLPDEVYNASKKAGINQNIIWDMMKDLERKVARKCKLL